MQNFIDVLENDKLSVSRGLFMNNLYTILSNNFGTVFPASNLKDGMLFFKHTGAESAIYTYLSTEVNPWLKIIDLKNAFGNADTLDGHHADYFSPATHKHDSDYLSKNGGTVAGNITATKFIGELDGDAKSIGGKTLTELQGLPLGHEYFTINPNLPEGVLPLIGQLVSRSLYPSLWEWVQTQNGFLLEESAWQSKASTNNGNVPYYSKGDGNSTFRLPSLKCYIKGSGGVREIGGYLAAGLPNITGSPIIGENSYNGLPEPGGAIYKANAGNSYAGSSDHDNDYYKFDASRSNSIYGKSDTVQPETIVGLWCVKAFGTIIDTGNTDMATYVSLLQQLDQKVSNLEDTFFTRTLTINGSTQGYRRSGSSATESDVTYDKTLTSIGSGVDSHYLYGLETNTGLPAQTDTLKSIIQKLVNLSHEHKTYRQLEYYNCQCNCSDGDGD